MAFSRLLPILLILFLFPSVYAAEEIPQSFTLDGRLFETGSEDPLEDTGSIIVQILNPTQDCVLYEETQTFNTIGKAGNFSLRIGSAMGSGTRSGADRNNSLVRVFSNTNSTAIDGKLASNGTTNCSYLATSGAHRRIRIKVIPSDMQLRVLAPDMWVDSVPNAMVAESAETLQGVAADQFAQLGAGSLTQTTLNNIFSNTNYPKLTGLLSGSSSDYVTVNGNGATLPGLASEPVGANVGQIWYDTSDNVLKYKDHTAVIKTVSSGTYTLPATGTAGTYTKVTTDAEGRVTSGTTLAETDIPTLSTAGKVSGSAINTGTIAGNTVISTTGAIGTSSSVSARVFDIYDSDNTNYVRLQTPATGDLTANYTLTLPTDAGVSGQYLSTNGSGTLTWAAPPQCNANEKLQVTAGPAIVWSCVTDENSGGDIAGITTGATSGLSGGATSGTPVLQVEVDGSTIEINGSNDLQVKDGGITDAKINTVGVGKITSAAGTDFFKYTPGGAECANGGVLKWNNTLDQWECGTDNDTISTGDVTEVTTAAGSGLTGGATSGAIALALDFGTGADQVQKNSDIYSACGAGQKFVMNPGPTYSWVCTNIAALQDADNDTKIQVEEAADEDKIRFDTAGTERMIIDSNGRVGIGTSSPNHSFEVVGNIFSNNTSDSNKIGKLEIGYVGSNIPWIQGEGGTIRSNSKMDFYTSGYAINGVYPGALTIAHGRTGEDISFATSPATDAVYAEAMRIKSSGQIGMGTASPNELLTVEGSTSLREVAAPTATANYGKIYVKTDSRLYFKDDSGAEFDLLSGSSAGDILGITTGASSGLSGGATSGTPVLQVEVDSSTIEINGSNDLQVKDGGITNAKIATVEVGKITSAAGTDFFKYTPGGAECANGGVLKWNNTLDQWECGTDIDTNTDAVSTVHGRSGAVVSANGDYTASQVTNAATGTIAANTVQAAIDELGTEKVAKVGDTLTGNLQFNAQTGTRYADADSDFHATIRAPATIPANYVLTLPDTDGNSGEILSTDGSGNLSWVSAAVGDITGVTTGASSGLSGGAASGTPVLQVEVDGSTIEINGSNDLQVKDGGITNAKIATVEVGKITSAAGTDFFKYTPGGAECANGGVLKWNNTLDQWECGTDTDTNSGGDVTEVTTAAGSGLTGGATSGAIALALDFGTGADQVQKNSDIYQNCAPGQKLVMNPGPTYSWVCTANATLADTDGDTRIQVEESADEDTIRFDTAGTERMVIGATGLVGIGTASPAEELDIFGEIAINGERTLAVFGDSLVVGRLSLPNTASYNNTAFGSHTLTSTSGNSNTAVGAYSLYSNTSGSANAAFGQNALMNATTDSNNTAVGDRALRHLTSGAQNTAVGAQAGQNTVLEGWQMNTTNSNSVYLGYNTRPYQNGSTNEIVIGHNSAGLGSNSVVLGNDSITTTALKGNVGIGTTVPNELLTVQGTISLRESAAPALTADYGKIYVKTDSRLYFKDDSGAEFDLLSGSSAGDILGITTGASSGLSGGATSGTPVLQVEVDGATIEINGSNDLQVKDGGITNAKIATVEIGKITSAAGTDFFKYTPGGAECANGGVLKWNNTLDQWECGTDNDTIATGDVTEVTTAAGSGLTGGATSGAIALALDFGTGADQVQKNSDIYSACGAGQKLVMNPGPTYSWVCTNIAALQDADNDTKIQVEETADEDKIRFDTAGVERMVVDSSGLSLEGAAALREITAPAATADYGKIYVKSDSRLYFKDDSGAEFDLLSGSSAGDILGITTGASSGLSGGATSGTPVLQVEVDGATIEINGSNDLQVKDGGITNAKIDTVEIGKITSAAGTDFFKYTPGGAECANGGVLKWNNTLDQWECGTDNDTIATGDVTEVTTAAGSGLTGGATSGAIALALDFGTGADQVQKNSSIYNACGAGQKLVMNPGPTYSWTCANIVALQDDDNDTKIQVEESADEDKIRFDTAGTERMVIESSGFVGIGTTTPQNELHLHDGGGSTADIRVTQASSGATSTDGLLLRSSGSDAYINNLESGFLSFATNGGERMHIAADGAVGIGTSSPLGKFDVQGTSYFGLTGTNMVRIEAGIVRMPDNLDAGRSLELQATKVSVGQNNGDARSASATALLNAGSTNDGTEILRLRTDLNTGYVTMSQVTQNTFQMNFVQNSVTQLYLRANGTVGIGTITPNELLTVEGTTSLRELASAPAATSNYGKIYVKTDNKLYFMNDAGVETDLLAGASAGDILGITTGASSGLSGGATSGTPVLQVEVDDATIEINGSNDLQVKDGGITNAKIASVEVGKITSAAGTDFFKYTPGGAECANGGVLKWNNTLDQWECGTDNDTIATGDVTEVTTAAGSGLTGGSTSGAIALALDFGTGADQVQKNSSIYSACGAGQKLVMNPGPTYSWTCTNIAALEDADNDTKIQVEETADEDKIRFDTAGTERMIIDNSGQVGIGTSTPSSRLHASSTTGSTVIKVEADPTNTNEAHNPYLHFLQDGGATYSYVGHGGDAGLAFGGALTGSSDNAFIIDAHGSGSDGKIQLATEGSVRMTVLQDGKVGIGTTNPGYTLDVRKNFTAGSWNQVSNIQSTASGSSASYNAALGAYYLMDNTVTGAGWSDMMGVMSEIRTANDGDSQSVTGFQVNMRTHPNDSGYGVYIRDQSAGNSTGGTQYGVYIDLSDTDVTRYGIYQNSANPNYFAGNVGIGTNSPNEFLTVEGVVSLREVAAPSATADYGKIYVKTDGNLYYKNDAGTETNLISGGGAVSTVHGRSGAVVSANGDYTASQVTNVAAGTVAATTVQAAIDELGTEKVAKSGDTMTGNLVLNAQSEIRLADSDSSNYISFRSPATASSNYTYTWPDTYGSNGDVLTSNSSGGLSWTTPANGDITAVTTAAGSGITGGANSGAVGLALDFGTGADQVQKNSAIYNACGAGQKLVMNSGPTYSWSCVAISATQDTDGDTKIQVEESADEDAIRFDTAGTERMIIDSTGRVGIGTAPTYRFDARQTFLTPTSWNEMGFMYSWVGGAGTADNYTTTLLIGADNAVTGANQNSSRALMTQVSTQNDAHAQTAIGVYSEIETHAGDSGFGIFVGNRSTASSTGGTMYGIYLNQSDTDVTNWGIFQASANNNYFAGNIGLSTYSPRALLDVSGVILSKAATSNGAPGTNIDFGTGNLQYTTSDCGAYGLHNLKDGGSYSFAVKGTNSTLCVFTAFTDAGVTPITVHYPPDHDVTISGKHTMYTLLVMGGDVYISWVPGL